MEKKLPEILVSFVSLADVLPNLKNHYIFWSMTNNLYFHANKFIQAYIDALLHLLNSIKLKTFLPPPNNLSRGYKSNHSALLHLINSIWFPLFHHPLFTSQQCLKKLLWKPWLPLASALAPPHPPCGVGAPSSGSPESQVFQDHLRACFLETDFMKWFLRQEW